MTRALERLVLVRHGETAGQSSIRYHGSTDVELNDTGRAQMARVAARLAGERFDLVLTSALRRTTAAAAIIAPGVPGRVVPEFNEIDFGDWEGLTREEIARRDPERFAAWQAARGDFVYPNGEAVAAFRARVARAWHAARPALPSRVLVVAHKGVITTLLGELLGIGPAERAAIPVDLASVHVLRAGGGGWVAEVLNDVGHLGGGA